MTVALVVVMFLAGVVIGTVGARWAERHLGQRGTHGMLMRELLDEREPWVDIETRALRFDGNLPEYTERWDKGAKDA